MTQRKTPVRLISSPIPIPEEESAFDLILALCRHYQIGFTWPVSLETGRALFMSILQRYEPKLAAIIDPLRIDADILNEQLIAKLKQYHPIDDSIKKGAPNQFSERLPAFARLERGKQQKGVSLRTIAKEIIEEKIFVPNSQPRRSNEPREAVLSQHRKDAAAAKKLDEERYLTLTRRWNEFLSKFDTSSHTRLNSLRDEVSACLTIADDDTQRRRRRRRLDDALLKAIVLLPFESHLDFYLLAVPPTQRYILAGEVISRSQSPEYSREYYRPPANSREEKRREENRAKLSYLFCAVELPYAARVLLLLRDSPMKIQNSFDKAIGVRFHRDSFGVINECTARTPEALKTAAVFTVDTLDLCWLGAQAAFESKAKPEHAFEIFDRLISILRNANNNQKPDDEVEKMLAQMMAQQTEQ